MRLAVRFNHGGLNGIRSGFRLAVAVGEEMIDLLFGFVDIVFR